LHCPRRAAADPRADGCLGLQPVTEELGIRAKLLSDGGPTMWAELMDELSGIRLGLKPKRRTGPSVGERLQAAYEKVMAKKAKG
jgi:hypothetical protein